MRLKTLDDHQAPAGLEDLARLEASGHPRRELLTLQQRAILRVLVRDLDPITVDAQGEVGSRQRAVSEADITAIRVPTDDMAAGTQEDPLAGAWSADDLEVRRVMLRGLTAIVRASGPRRGDHDAIAVPECSIRESCPA